MIDPAALTDEQLAEISKGHEGMDAPFKTPQFCRRCSHFWPCPTARLIAALRASRAEAERLRGEVEGLTDAYDALKSDADAVVGGLKLDNARAEAEVERLNASLGRLLHVANSRYRVDL